MSDDALSDLRAEVAALRAELADLRAGNAAATDPPPTADTGPDRGRMSRRGLLAAAVAGGAGLIATQVTTAAPAAAAPGNPVVLGANNDGVGTITVVTSEPGLNSSTFAVVNPNTAGQGVGLYAQLGARTDRFDGSGNQRAAVIGDSRANSGVTGLSVGGSGVYGSSDNTGVRGEGGIFGVIGRSGDAEGAGVYGLNTGAGRGVYAFSSSGAALSAVSTASYGVEADGGLAPLRLTPRGARRSAATTSWASWSWTTPGCSSTARSRVGRAPGRRSR